MRILFDVVSFRRLFDEDRLITNLHKREFVVRPRIICSIFNCG